MAAGTPSPGPEESRDVNADSASGLNPSTFPVVGIGASAGGLAAIESFFSGMAPDRDCGVAFVLVQHLAPDHKSILTELVGRCTRMRVFEVEDGMKVQPDCVYIIPPNCDMAVLNGTLQLLEPSMPRGRRLPIDFFFRSLAQDQRERAICIVLSGTGSDGTLGARAIKGEGGMVMVQSPDSAEYDGMPRSALSTGLVDFELHPSEMPAQLIAYIDRAFGKPVRPAPALAHKAENALMKVFMLLRAQTGHDFSQYKPGTIQRRIERRIAVQQVSSIEEYVKYLSQSPSEVEALFRDLLIGVTSFFRDLEAVKVIEEQVVPAILGSKPLGAPVRVWSPGCSTGEEAYSVAMLLAEGMDALKRSFTIQVFATDIDGQAISLARAGLYPSSIASDISPERLAEFFVAELDGSAYRISKYIRDTIVFSEHDVISDPPFSRLDLISCRNLLIYMGSDLQKKLIPLFHYALNPGGYLVLGTSETVGEFSNLFSPLDRRLKVYQRKEDVHGTSRAGIGGFLQHVPSYEVIVPQPVGRIAGAGKTGVRDLTEQAMLQHFAPAGALVNGRGDVLYFHGRTGLYLEPAPGEAAEYNILRMAREGLRHSLTTALNKASVVKQIVRSPGVQVKTNGGFTTVNLTIRPVLASPESSRVPLYVVILEEGPPIEPEQEAKSALMAAVETDSPDAEANARVIALQRALQAKDDYLQTANEELATSNEDLRSSNEELQSVNEELQSTNEELETSKEELQSVNEELSTVNAELQAKLADLARANNDMNNLLAGSGIGTIFVDHQQRILRFTPTVTRIINLIPGDVGRPVSHIVTNLEGYDRLSADVQQVLDSLVQLEREVRTRGGDWYSLRILPYRTLDNVIEGAVITFIDIALAKRVEDALRSSEQKNREIIESISGAFLSLDVNMAVKYFNPAAERMLKCGAADAIGRRLYDVLPEARGSVFEEHYQRCAQTRTALSFEARFTPLQNWYEVRLYPEAAGISVLFQGIAERKAAEAALHDSEAKSRELFESMPQGVVFQDREGRILDANPAAQRILGLTLDEMSNPATSYLGWKAFRDDGTAIAPEESPSMTALKTGREVHGVVMGFEPPGKETAIWLRATAIPQFRPGEDTPYQVYTTLEEITGSHLRTRAASQADGTPP